MARNTDSTIRIARITAEDVEFIDVPPHVDELAAAIDTDVIEARATWPMNGSGVLTAWAPRTTKAGLNDLAARVVVDLMPPDPPLVAQLPTGIRRDQTRRRLTQRPLSGTVVITGYDRGTGRQASLNDVAVERIRSAVDGRKAARSRAAADAPTADLPARDVIGEIIRDVVQDHGTAGRSDVLTLHRSMRREPTGKGERRPKVTEP